MADSWSWSAVALRYSPSPRSNIFLEVQIRAVILPNLSLQFFVFVFPGE
jgi:hypothetical protein